MSNLKEQFLNSVFIYTPHPAQKTDHLKETMSSLGIKSIKPEDYKKGNVIIFGKMRGQYHVMKRCKEQNYNFFYIDNGYFPTDKSGTLYYRITYNGENIPAKLKYINFKNKEKESLFDLKFEKFNNDGEYILLIPPSPFRQLFDAENANIWILDIIEKIKDIIPSGKKIFVKRKMDVTTNLNTVLDNSYAVIVHSSTVGIKSIMKGKYTFCTDKKFFLATVTETDVKKINDFSDYTSSEKTKEREKFIKNLVHVQYSLEELESGKFLDILQKVYE